MWRVTVHLVPPENMQLLGLGLGRARARARARARVF